MSQIGRDLAECLRPNQRRRSFLIPTYYHDRMGDYKIMTKERYDINLNAENVENAVVFMPGQ